MSTLTTSTGTRAPAKKRCPRCTTALDGGPVLFHCPTCKKSVYAADLDNEFPATLGRAA